MTSHPHLWLALSPHGFGHAAMTAPVIEELRRLRPGMRLTIQSSVSRHFLESRYPDFTLVPEIDDFGFKMKSSTMIDLEGSAAGYLALHADFDRLVAREAERLRAAAVDLVLSNVAYVPLAAAAQAGIPAVALSSLNWADMVEHYLGHRPEMRPVLQQIRAAYDTARAFLRCTPAQPMTLSNLVEIGPVARKGRNRRQAMPWASKRVGLISFGGIDHPLALDAWPEMPGWHWILGGGHAPDRPDMTLWTELGMEFSDLIASVDLIITKPGYGTFTEAAMSGIPVLYVPRPDWPESPPLEHWLASHTKCLSVPEADLFGAGLQIYLRTLFSLPNQEDARPDGVIQAAQFLSSELDYCMRS